MATDKKFTIGLLSIVIILVIGIMFITILDVFASETIAYATFLPINNSGRDHGIYPVPTLHPTPHPYPSPTPPPAPVLNQYLPTILNDFLSNLLGR